MIIGQNLMLDTRSLDRFEVISGSKVIVAARSALRPSSPLSLLDGAPESGHSQVTHGARDRRDGCYRGRALGRERLTTE